MLTLSELRILESVGLSGMGALLRGGKKKPKKAEHGMYCSGAECEGCESARIAESSRVIQCWEAGERKETGGKEGPIVKVVLISEGLGNLRDKNYYGPEAIQSAPGIFEGVQMLLDHQSYSEETDRPEGDVNKTVAYYKNLRIEAQADGRLACVGEAHFDLSEEGRNAYLKAKTAVHYSEEFPGSDKEYVGLSVNATGESEPRTMVVDGQEMDVNYVLRFVEARSCDMVTIPARGGKLVATVESIAGARMKHKEVRMKTVETLQAIQKGLKEAEGLDAVAKNPDLRQKISEARKQAEALIKGVLDAVAARAKAREAEDEAEDEDESDPSLHSDKRPTQKDEDESDMGTENGDSDGDADAGGGGDQGDTHTVVKHQVVKKTGKAALMAQKGESMRLHRLAVKQLVQESGLNAKYFDLKELESMTLNEAEREIARTKRVHEASAEELVKRFGEGAFPAMRSKESSGGSNDDGGSVEPVNNAAFADLSVL